jgi:hypothetical protein
MKTQRIIKFIPVFLLIALLASCEYEFIEITESAPPPDPTASIISFSVEIAPIFSNDNCVGCHNGSFKFDLRPDAAYNSIISNNLVEAENPANSEIYTYSHPVTGTHKKYSTVAEADSIAKWIYQGALDN